MVNDEITIAQNERFLLQKEYLGENKPINQIQPIVSVTVATYQHVNYIRKCLDGILMQKTNFPYEIILGEDGSVDGTQEICKEYAEKYPDKIRLFIRDRKLSQYIGKNGKVTRFNGIWNRMSSRGKYIAWCEGDDYWIEPLKLQRQVDFLESHQDYSMCFHNAFKLYMQRGKVELFNNKCCDEDLSVHDAIHDWIVPTASILVRKDVAVNYPKWLARIYSGDYSLILLSINAGKVRYINEIMSVYRINETGTSATAAMKHCSSFVLKQQELLLDSFNKGTEGRYKDEIEKRIDWLKREIKFNEAKEKHNIYLIICMPKGVISKVIGKFKSRFKILFFNSLWYL